MKLRFLHSIRLMLFILVTIAVLPSLMALLSSGFVARNKALNDATQDIQHRAENMAVIQERITASTQVMLSSLARVPVINNFDLPACRELFKELVKLNPIYTNILMADRNGDIIASAVPYPSVNLANQKHFKDACRTRKFSTGEYFVSRATREPAFPFSYPIFDKDGNVQSVLVAAVELERYRQYFSEELFPKGSFFCIADHAGRRLFRIPPSEPEFELGEPVDASVWNSLKPGVKNGVLYQKDANISRIVAYSKLDNGPGTPTYMYIFVGIPENILEKNASNVMFINAMLAALSWLLALFLSWLVGRNLFLKKISRLTEFASRFGAGNLHISTGVDHQAGELGQVAEAFDQMANQLLSADKEREKLQDQLIQSQKLESVGRLAGGVAHDFNNMLMVIMGHSEMILQGISNEHPYRSGLEDIHKAASKSANLTRQLLAFARKQTISPVVLDINETIAGMLKMLQRLIGENIRMIWIPEKSVWPIKVDPAQIDQVLANLTVNARDAIEDVGNITIETANMSIDDDYCADHLESAPGDYLMLSVSDDGSGMDRNTQAKIFEPFFTTKASDKGTGMGLSIVHGIVKQNHGFINVYSEPGKGTCFKIYFPRFIQDGIEENATQQNEISKGNGELILLVEDEISILNLGKTMLEQLGYQVVAASSPTEMLSKISTLPCLPRLLITDVVMPKMNGRELADRVKQVYPDVKCIFMSGYTSNVIAHQGVLDDGVHFMEKPFSMTILASKVKQMLDAQ